MTALLPARPPEGRLPTEVGDEPTEVRLFRRMAFIRRFEETLLELFDEGILQGTTHCCIGQEADAVAVAEWIRPGDHVFSNHRCHGHYLALTGDGRGLLAEIMGHPDGVCAGKGGSQHLWAPGFASNGILGGTAPTAAGIAMGMQLDDAGAVSVVFLGDGALGEGIVYETLNLASLWNLPLLFVVEDNAWAQTTPSHHNLAGSITRRFEAFGVPALEIDSTDVLELRDAAATQLAATRSGGPHALVIHTYRLCHHSKNDDHRPPDEVAQRWALDPLVVHGPRVDDGDRGRILREVAAAMDDIVADLRRPT